MDTNSFSKDSALHNLYKSIDQPFLFSNFECCLLETYVQDLVKLATAGFYKEHTIDRALLRTKYFFGERYTYGGQMPHKGRGMERLYPYGLIDPIPSWIYSYIIKPLVAENIIEANFVNSAVINEYSPGGCIASHIDPPHIFDRPLISISLFSDSALCFGCKFEYKPIRCSEPILQLPLPRGIVTLLSGFSADDITHCVRPEDTRFYRVVIVLRRVLSDAPRLKHLNTLTDNSFDLVTSPSLKLECDSDGILKKFYEKYSKARKWKRNNYGGISKVGYTKKTFFADNKQYTNRPYKLNDV